MFSFFTKIYSCIDIKDKKYVFPIAILIILNTIVELIGIGVFILHFGVDFVFRFRVSFLLASVQIAHSRCSRNWGAVQCNKTVRLWFSGLFS